MNDKLKIALAKECGLTDELYVESVRTEISETYKYADEVAILRKAVSYLFELIATLHAGEISNEEFAEYNSKVEAIKTAVKDNLNIE
jgi:hypothetical protein